MAASKGTGIEKSKLTLETLEEALGGNRELVLFFLTWLQCDRNAQKAYKKLHPTVTDGSAAVLGSRLLKKVHVSVILDSMGLGVDKYLEVIAEGLAATTEELEEVTEERVIGKKTVKVKKWVKVKKPNWAVRNHHHEKLGMLHKFEGLVPAPIALQVNNTQNIAALPEQEIDGLLDR